jgi:transcriptional regulator with XRE-family HTH domain
MADTPPLRWLIGSELKRYREDVGNLSLNDAADRAGVTRSKINNLERGIQAQHPEDIATLLTAYGVPARDIDRLSSLTGRADEAMWWAPWRQVLPDWLRTYVGLEALAERVFTFEPLVITGLLQTEAYASALTGHEESFRKYQAQRFVSLRMGRTRRLTDSERPLELHAVIPESVLRLAVGTADVRRDQLQHLLQMAELSTVTIQVLRPEDGPYSGISSGNFVVLDFGSAARPVVYVELQDGAVYLQDEMQVEAYTMATSDLRQVAMSPEHSHEHIASLLSQYEGGTDRDGDGGS